MLYSTFLWHQQTLQDEENTKEIGKAVGEAVREANQHSDGQFEEANQHSDQKFQEVEGHVTSLQTTVDNGFKETKGEVDTDFSKFGKPEPPERPKLRFSLWEDGFREDEFPLESMDVQPDKDGNVQIPFFIRNDSEVEADGVEFWVYICDVCSFAKEPTGFDRPEGLEARARHRSIPGMNPGVSIREGNTIDVKVNQVGITQIQIMFKSVCKTCGPPETSQKFLVRIEPVLTLPQ